MYIYPVDICIYPSFDDQFYSDFLPKRHPIKYRIHVVTISQELMSAASWLNFALTVTSVILNIINILHLCK